MNTFARSFAIDGESSSSRKKYVRTVMHVAKAPPIEFGKMPPISFSWWYAEGVLTHEDDLMLINL